jgi:hypothetical protein
VTVRAGERRAGGFPPGLWRGYRFGGRSARPTF